jgi:glucan biosynthesis protein
MSKYRVQINAQATVYEKTGRKVTETANISGLIVPQEVDEEREYECKQYAVAFNGTQLKESEVDEKLRQLCAGVKKTMFDKGLIY